MMFSAVVCAFLLIVRRQRPESRQQLVIHFARAHDGRVRQFGPFAEIMLSSCCKRMAFGAQYYHRPLRQRPEAVVTATLLLKQAVRQHRQRFIGIIADDITHRFQPRLSNKTHIIRPRPVCRFGRSYPPAVRN